jgi:hypothetical protein
VERTLQATVGSAQLTRGRAQEAVDEIFRGAGAGAETLRKSVRGALPVTQEDVKAIRADLRAINRRLDAIEARLPAARARTSSAPKRAAAKPKPRAKPKPKPS